MLLIASVFTVLFLTLVASGFSLAQTVNITHGPMLGHVTAESISIWARTSKPGQFHVHYGRMPIGWTRFRNPRPQRPTGTTRAGSV